MRFLAIMAAALFVAGGPAFAKECRIPDTPPGVRIQLPPECKDLVRAPGKEAGSLKADAGFIDLGNGTKVRVGGRVRAEMGVRR